MFSSKTVLTAFISALLLVSPSGCSDDDAVKPPDGSTPDLDTANLEPDTQPDVLTITVVVAPSSRTKEAPIEGASVAVDLPGGKRLEDKTDASGEATFHVNWAGPVDVIAAKAGYAIFSSSGLTRTTGQHKLYLTKRTLPRTVMIKGKGIGGDSTATGISVSASTGVTAPNPCSGRDFFLRVEAEKPSTLIGLQWTPGLWEKTSSQKLQVWATAEWDGKGTAPTLDLDFNKPMKTTTFKGTLIPPAIKCKMATSTYAYIQVFGQPPWASQVIQSKALAGQPPWTAEFGLGYLEKRSYANDIHTYEGKYVTSKAAVHPVTKYLLIAAGWKNDTWVIKDGYPQEGATITGFLCEPTLKTPPPNKLTLPVKLSTKFEWNSVDKSADASIYMWDENGRTVWWAMLPAGTTSLTLPKLPSGVNQNELLGTKYLTARLYLCAERDWSLSLCRRGSRTKEFRIDPSL